MAFNTSNENPVLEVKSLHADRDAQYTLGGVLMTGAEGSRRVRATFEANTIGELAALMKEETGIVQCEIKKIGDFPTPRPTTRRSNMRAMFSGFANTHRR